MSFETYEQVGLSKEDASGLARRARIYLFADGTYRTTPPERPARGQISVVRDSSYVSGTDLATYPGKLAAFQEVWEALTRRQQAYVLGRAHARDRREWTVEMDNGGQHATVRCHGLDDLVLHRIWEDASVRFDCWPLLPVTLYFPTELAAEDFRRNNPRFADGKIMQPDNGVLVRWHTGLVMFGDLGEAMQYAVALAAHYPDPPR